MLAVVAIDSRVWLPSFGKRLHCPGSFVPLVAKTHVPVGYCWQNSRCRRPVLRPRHNYNGDLVSHAIVQRAGQPGGPLSLLSTRSSPPTASAAPAWINSPLQPSCNEAAGTAAVEQVGRLC